MICYTMNQPGAQTTYLTVYTLQETGFFSSPHLRPGSALWQRAPDPELVGNCSSSCTKF